MPRDPKGEKRRADTIPVPGVFSGLAAQEARPGRAAGYRAVASAWRLVSVMLVNSVELTGRSEPAPLHGQTCHVPS